MNAPNAKPLDLSKFAGHTPGPWHVSRIGAGTYVETRSGYVVSHIADSLAYKPAHAANAAVMAAAPDLLAECKAQRERIAELESALALAAGTFTSIYLEAAPATKNRLAQKLGKWADQGNTEARAVLAKVSP